MQTRTATKIESSRSEVANPVLRKIWLPKFLYDCLPYFYLVSGIAALLTTLYISNWYWIVPHYFLFSVACVHFGILVFRRRRTRERDSA
ncbi:MAG: hypothetical protein QNJ19_15285 [Woeseiaceae bacterium]|nr:hypothetical protein [Woeseiaceae bacterium]